MSTTRSLYGLNSRGSAILHILQISLRCCTDSLNPDTSQWDYISQSTTDANGQVGFQGLKESELGTYYYKISCQMYDCTPAKFLVTYPVIFVHGWRGTKDTWNYMTQTLDNAGLVKGFHYFVFNYDGYDDPRVAVLPFKKFIEQTKDTLYNISKSSGMDYARDDIKFTIVCHSMGALVTRSYMEQMGGAKNVAQWIGIAPINHGTAVADKIPDSMLSNPVQGYDPYHLGPPAVVQMRTNSPTVKMLESPKLEAQRLKSGVTYRVIVGDNEKKAWNFGVDCTWLTVIANIIVGGKTWASLPGCACKPLPNWEEPGCCNLTLRGDVAVANVQSWLDSADFQNFTGLDHIGLLKDRNVANYVLYWIENPETKVYPVPFNDLLRP